MIDQRPILHMNPERGWLNDPNGPFQWRGRHHVFHQFDPESLWFGHMKWGHFSSDDLVRWEQHPAALSPSQDADRDGVWSGCVVDDGGTATAIYTGVVKRADGKLLQSVCLATSTDPNLIEWTKDPGNPMAIEPPDFEVDAFRDPYVWKEANGWAMLLGTGLPDGNGGVLLYRSSDLRDWSFQGVLISGADLPAGAPWTGSVWECPNLVVLESGEALLLVSVHDSLTLSLHYTVAIIGHLNSGRLDPMSAQRLDHGHDCYAVAVEKTADGRILGYGWAFEAVSAEDREKQKWAGCMTVPRELGVRDGRLTVAPARELGDVPAVVNQLEETVVTPSQPVDLLVPRAARIDAHFQLDHTSALRVAIRSSPQSGEQLTFEYSGSRGSIVVDRGQSSSLPGIRGGISTADYLLPADGRLDLTVIIDHTIVEIFVGGRVAFSERIYPQALDADHLRIESLTETFGEKPASFCLEHLTVSAFAPSRRAVTNPAKT